MKKAKIALAAFLAAAAISAGTIAAVSVSGAEKAKSDATEKTSAVGAYMLNDWYDVPKKTISVDGREYAAVAATRFPDGSYTREEGFFLTLEGTYTVTYTAVVEGKTYTEETKFTVNGTGVAAKAVITIDFGTYGADNLPAAEIGKEYALFPAKATVGRIAVGVGVKVYYLYGAHSRLSVETKNGAFVPDRAGEYEAEYTAENFYGETETKTFRVLAVNDAVQLSAVPSRVESTAGKETVLPLPAVTKDDRFGTLSVRLTAAKGNYKETVYEGTYGEEVPRYSFPASGEWQLEWEIFDYSRSVTCISSADVTAPEAEFFNAEQVTVEPVFLRGRTYRLPEVKVLTYDENGVKYENAAVSVAFGDGGYSEIENHTFTADTDAAKIGIKWSYGELNKTIEVPVASLTDDNGGIDTSALLGGKATVSEDGLEVDTATTKQLKFTNKLHTGSMTLNLNLADFSANAGFTLSLTDPYDKANTLLMRFTVNGDGGITVRGAGNDSVALKAHDGTVREINISYANKSRLLKVDNGIDKEEKNTLSVGGFGGFQSDEAFLNVDFTGNGGKFILARINGQKLGEIGRDAIAPKITVNGTYTAEIPVGKEFEIYSAYALDVLDGYRNAVVNVKDAETGEFLQTVDGKTLNGLDASATYKVVANKRQRIRIQYQAKDLSGRDASEVMYISALGEVSPEIAVGEIVQTVAKTGDKLVLPAYSAKDPLGGNVEIFVAVFDPEGKGSYINGEYVFTKKGSYKIVIAAFDEEGNMAEYCYYTEVV